MDFWVVVIVLVSIMAGSSAITAIVNAIKAETAMRLTAANHPPKVLTAASIVGPDESTRLFESAYDEHAHRIAKLYENVGVE